MCVTYIIRLPQESLETNVLHVIFTQILSLHYHLLELLFLFTPTALELVIVFLRHNFPALRALT